MSVSIQCLVAGTAMSIIRLKKMVDNFASSARSIRVCKDSQKELAALLQEQPAQKAHAFELFVDAVLYTQVGARQWSSAALPQMAVLQNFSQSVCAHAGADHTGSGRMGATHL